MKKWKEENEKMKGRKRKNKERKINEKNNIKSDFVTNIVCKGMKLKKKISAFWNKLFENFYFNPFLWNGRVCTIFFVFWEAFPFLFFV